MEYSQGSLGRIFVIRLSDGEDLIGSLDRFLAEKEVASGMILFLGALRRGRIVAGPRKPTIPPESPFVQDLEGGFETFGVATVYPGEGGGPKVHIHASFGRDDQAFTGCLRERGEAYLVVEVVVFEFLGLSARRVFDEESGLLLANLKERF